MSTRDIVDETRFCEIRACRKLDHQSGTHKTPRDHIIDDLIAIIERMDARLATPSAPVRGEVQRRMPEDSSKFDRFVAEVRDYATSIGSARLLAALKSIGALEGGGE